MSAASSSRKPTRPPFEVKVAETRDEVEACFDIRVEGQSMSEVLSTPFICWCATAAHADGTVFHVEQGFSLDDEIDQ